MAYKKKSLRKMFSAFRDLKSLYEKAIANGEKLFLAISTGNRKIGRVLNVSLPPVLTCGRACGVCYGICYDIKACMQYGNVRKARIRNLVILQNNRDDYFEQIRQAIKRKKTNFFFRWHVSGDIVDIDYFSRMVDIAREFPNWIFWTYTKQYSLVNEYVKIHGKSKREAIPQNLCVMFSAWDGLEMENPYGFPTFECILTSKGEQLKKDVFVCPGNCDLCKSAKTGCIKGENTQVLEH